MLPTVLTIAALCGSAFATSRCTAKDRIYHSSQIPYSYSQNSPGASNAAFKMIPFGVPDLDGPCPVILHPNGLAAGIPVGLTGNDAVRFGTVTRQAFSSVTGAYIDFPENGTTLLNANVTLGIRSTVPIPITFGANVYLDFNPLCRITALRAWLQIPEYINGKPVSMYELLGLSAENMTLSGGSLLQN